MGDIEILLFTPRETAKMLRCRPEKVYKLIHGGELAHIQDGNGFKVPRWAIDDWIRAKATTG